MNGAGFQFGLIVTSVLGVFFIMSVGAFCRTRHWLTREADVSLAKLTTNILLPSLFLDRILNDPNLGSITSAWIAPSLGFSFTAFGLLAAWGLAKTIGPSIGLVTDSQQRAFTISAGICNYGYIPLPLSQMFYPDAEVDLILHNVGVDLALWSIGIAIVSGGRGPQQGSQQGRVISKLLPVLTSKPLIAVAIAMTIRGFGWEDYVPSPATKAIKLLAGASIPMGLILSGAIIIDFIKSAEWSGASRVIALSIGFRQVAMPMLMLVAAANLLTRVDLKQVILLQAAMPSAVFPIVLVRLYHGDTATALRVVLSTSIAGLLLIPLWIALGGWWLGI